MARFLIRSVLSTIVTMLLVSALLFLLMEVMGRSVSVQVLGVFATPEQLASYDNQLGLDQPSWQRYVDWLVGSDWRVRSKVGHPVVAITNLNSDEKEWWADMNGALTRWKMVDGEMVALVRNEDGSSSEQPATDVWTTDVTDAKAFGGWIPKITWFVGKKGVVPKSSS